MRSKSRLTSKADRRSLPLKAMCSRKCDTPDTSGVSSREPVRTKKPSATDRADGLVSPMMVRPLASLWLWKGMALISPDSGGDGQRGGAERDDAEVHGRVAAKVLEDPGGA